MNWLNEPASWQHDGNRITMRADAQTDFWRITHSNAISDTGHFYNRPVTGNFVAEVRFSADYHALYDQAGLMVRVDEANWIKCGIELFEGVQQASAVVTRDFSDWSVVPLPDSPPEVWLRVKREGHTFEVSYSLTGERFVMLRQAYLTQAETVDVGVMCCAPTGKGFQVVFEDFGISSAPE